ncbi:hypothetical protein COCC4DRAFT_137372 [Bipolaris maydis ATCC 48331]|uniref:Uncharacterized protein n=2 Tax=Cochliobolus heterostrophus TaxID=5016 RepID=M2TPY4_COCH5|nr:uncharacterized protein COCC4DRAFT_137372 [Bipolaris maydis ATCC 48331]EMD88624.1 hypothetical protein COCHEDRAFT_1110637 [Bipolaris maydis C5]KAJ5028777.1 hypothetical protein J3E73DRAFT_255307 [Bipolaris maydis]ENI05660.1 hypothetical protein COCC4DRAFT_137372 [Bipolaris maydis ATCC 48331]KAJ5042542.1 hypothetical protein J3E74DRAFT_230808 [Bipolaris maydis]KAJ5063566.1 hypothetical protein J3E74DRAFT_208576 [Bipolaris maydis]
MQTQQSWWQYFLLSFLSLLAIRYASSADTPSNTTLDAVAAITCQSEDQPNPIASTYPNNATGVLNGTVSIVPIPLNLARQLIPSQYRILEHAYRHLLPTFPKDMYPAVVQAVHDHDIQFAGFKIPDFSRAGIEFPFLDLLGDNSTSFKWVPSLLISADNAGAIQGAQAYGTTTYPSTFDPTCNSYRSVPNAPNPGTTAYSGRSTESGAACTDTQFHSTTEAPYPLAFFVNVTNQIIFANGSSCDNMIRLFNTSLSTAPNRIENVKGSVRAKMEPFKTEQVWDGVYGIRFASAFIENNYLPCENFRGYGA